MAEVGTYYITIMPEMSSFTKSVNTALGNSGTSGGKSFVGSFGDIVKGSALGTVLGQLAGKLGSTVASGFSTGISRIDTLENFPRVMQSLGYNAGDAAGAIQLIRKRLDGLPTATQDVVSLTQAIADSTGDLGLATDAALGFNDMLLASGASTAEVTQAQGVFNRILGKGNATTAQWQSLQSVMPAQLAMVARELLGEGASVEELREKLNDGTVSWDDFLGAIVKLDSEGSGAMSSFYEQAKANSVGIGTAIKNVQNRIGDGWATIMQAIGQKEIAGAIDTMSYGIRDAMRRIADGVRFVADLVKDSNIGESLKTIFDTIGSTLSGILTEDDVQTLKDMATALVGLIDGALSWLAEHGEVVAVAVGAIAGAVGTMFGLKIMGDIMALPALLETLGTALTAGAFGALGPITVAIGALAIALYNFFTQTEAGKAIWQGFCDLMSELWAGLQEDWSTLCSVLSREWESFQAFIDGIPAWWAGVCDYWRNQWAEFQTIMATSVQELKDNWNRSLDDIKNKAVSIFDSIRSAIKEKVDGARDAVHDAIERIKGFFNFTWSLPRLKLPHISISGSFSLNPPSVPHFGISWWANGNGVFAPNRPRIIGVGDNRTEREFLNTESQMRGLLTAAVRAGGGGSGGVTVTGNTFVVREEADIDRISERLSVLWSRQMGGALA